MRIAKRIGALACGLALLLGGTACSPGSSDSGSGADDKASSDWSPVTVENCGRSVTVENRPQRIMTIHPSMTEALVAMGAGDQIVGQAFTRASGVSDEYKAEVDKVPSLSDRIPSQEKVLELDPDLIVASGEFWFDGERMQTLEYFEKKGVPVFINSTACKATTDAGGAKLENAWNDIEALGKLTGHEEKAKELVNDYKEEADKAKEALGDEQYSAAMVQMYEGDIVAMATGLYTDILSQASLTNVFDGDLPDGTQYSVISAEALIGKDPDFILVNYASPEAKDADVAKVKELFANTSAVKNNRVIPVSEGPFLGVLGSPAGVKYIANEVSARA